jgi:P-type Mg2+ transporter
MRRVTAIPSIQDSTSPLAGIELVEAARLPSAEVVAGLRSAATGLTAAEAAVRLRRFGHNAVRSHGAQPLAVLVRQLRNPLLILLAAATLISLLVGQRTDAIIILAIVGLSVGLGFFNEYRSERVVEALHASIRHQSLVLRDAGQQTIDVTELVPGDVVVLRTGDLVPADLRLLDARDLECGAGRRRGVARMGSRAKVRTGGRERSRAEGLHHVSRCAQDRRRRSARSSTS